MKKVLIIAVTIVAVIALGNVLLASAQDGTQPNPPNPTCPASGYTCPFSGTLPSDGMMGQGGMMHGGTYTSTMPMHNYMMGQNGMHEQVWTAVAEKLGLTYAELNTALQNGQTIVQLAEAKGVSLDALRDAALAAMRTSFADLVEQGLMTQDQADWMLEHMDEMSMFNFNQSTGPGMMHGRGSGGMMHGWQQPAGPQG